MPLHRCVTGEGPPPHDHLVGLVCAAFSCVPSVAEAELDDNGDQVLEILAMRNYLAAKAAYDAIGDLDQAARLRVLADPMVAEVRRTEQLLVEAELAAEAGDG